MKNRALTVVLVLVVGFIWYKAFFRVKDSFFGEDEAATNLRPNDQPVIFASLSRDTFAINLDYRDPFGETKRSYDAAPPTTIQVPNKQPAAVRVKRGVDWPAIVYYGQVKRTTSKDPLAILSIDGYQHTMRQGEKIYDGITVKAIGRDSMVITYQKERRVFWRGN